MKFFSPLLLSLALVGACSNNHAGKKAKSPIMPANNTLDEGSYWQEVDKNMNWMQAAVAKFGKPSTTADVTYNEQNKLKVSDDCAPLLASHIAVFSTFSLAADMRERAVEKGSLSGYDGFTKENVAASEHAFRYSFSLAENDTDNEWTGRLQGLGNEQMLSLEAEGKSSFHWLETKLSGLTKIDMQLGRAAELLNLNLRLNGDLSVNSLAGAGQFDLHSELRGGKQPALRNKIEQQFKADINGQAVVRNFKLEQDLTTAPTAGQLLLTYKLEINNETFSQQSAVSSSGRIYLSIPRSGKCVVSAVETN